MKPTLSILMLLFSTSTSWAMGSRPRTEDAPQLRTRVSPAHSSLFAVEGWATSTRELKAYALVLERMLWVRTSEGVSVDQHWVEFHPSPLAQPEVAILPDRFRLAKKTNGKPAFVAKYNQGLYHLQWRMDLGLFGKDRAEIERLSIRRGIQIKMAEFDPSDLSTTGNVRLKTPVEAERFYAAVSEYRGTEQANLDPWVAEPYVYGSADMTRKQYREFRRRMNRQGEPVHFTVTYSVGLARPLTPGAQATGPEGRVNTMTEWVEHQAEGALACIDLDHDGAAEADTSSDCAEYWE